MFKKIIIQADERGLLFNKGRYMKPLDSGIHWMSTLRGDTVTVMNVMKPFSVPGKELNLFLQDEELLRQLDVVDVQDFEYVLHYEDGKFAALLTAGKYAFWNSLKRHRFVRVDIREPEIGPDIDLSIVPKLAGYVHMQEVASGERGLLHYNNVMKKELPPGKYYFWRGPVQAVIKTIDLRQQQLDLTGQEMMTEDKITLRLNFVCQYRVVEPLRALEIKSFEEQIYIQLQLVLREYVGTLKLDELLRTKQEIAAYALSRLNEKSAEFGIKFLSAGVKDIILPGEIRDILNTVLLAEKKAQANLITRREETASTRSLLNTAKLMDENQTLFRLKELEFLEKICEKIGTISLSGGSNLLERLNMLVGSKGDAS
ncbi:slipin family protein [Paenibacillus mendelii]|uniref:Slipin family protein n=1 Tax=Paenibacillus mendelii TaxID=206163 RepID=A0ABV6JKG1_9BACL|nr:slipin family protein [Paenibacillus mendelii]MCQ6563080.1 slipin family protein [Paenibacillus mendelii]